MYTLAIEEVFPHATHAMLLRGLRIREDVTQEEFAARLGIPVAQVVAMENGTCPVSADMAQRIANEFNTTPKIFQQPDAQG